jgi:hypothetical protein
MATKAPAAKKTAAASVSDKKIREIAHSLWVEAGKPEGQAEDHWFKTIGKGCGQTCCENCRKTCCQTGGKACRQGFRQTGGQKGQVGQPVNPSRQDASCCGAPSCAPRLNMADAIATQ